MKWFLAIMFLCLAPLAAQAAPPEPKTQVLSDNPVSGDETKHAVTVRVQWPAGSATQWHTHPGDEYAVVLRGELVVRNKEGIHEHKAGETYHNPRDVAHVTYVVGKNPAETIAVLVVDKGKSVSETVK